MSAAKISDISEQLLWAPVARRALLWVVLVYALPFSQSRAANITGFGIPSKSSGRSALDSLMLCIDATVAML